jgi:glycosyltransferase involved in cell wall biosynthesis
MNHKTIRVLHCPTYGAGQAGILAMAERRLGLDSSSVSIEPAAYGFSIDHAWNPFRSRILSMLTKELMRWPLLIHAAINADVIHYNFGQTIMPQWYGSLEPVQLKGLKKILAYFLKCYVLVLERLDVIILKALGKKIIVTYQGDDARQGDYCLQHYTTSAAGYVNSAYYNSTTDRNKRRLIEKLSQKADQIFALNPDLLNVLPKDAQFLPYCNVDILSITPVVSEKREIPIVIHAPTHRDVKGTSFILDAVERLKHEGVAFEFVLVEGLSHKEALKLYAKADLLVDQLLVGWYGGLAVELMAMAKPVICYVREEDLGFLPSKMQEQLPLINADINNVYEVLKQYLTKRKDELPLIGLLSRKFVEEWHDPAKVALRLKGVYENIY